LLYGRVEPIKRGWSWAGFMEDTWKRLAAQQGPTWRIGFSESAEVDTVILVHVIEERVNKT
jgi:hypothetical protein